MEQPKQPVFTVCGYLNGKHYSKPGIAHKHIAVTYASLKGWSDIKIIFEGMK
jgi:hypothetical protein